MSFEKPPTLPESPEPKISTPEIKNQEEFEEKILSESVKKTATCLSPENQGFFSKMSENGKKIASQIYEGLYKTPGVNKVVGKLEIAYNQFWIDKHEEKVIKLKNKIDNLDLKNSLLNQSKKEIESVTKGLKQQNIPGVESLQLKLKNIDRQNLKLLNKKDKIQSKFEYRDNKMKLYVNERDKIADKLISRYNEKLKPIEKELGVLQTYKDQVDLLVAVTEAEHKEQIIKLDDIEIKKIKIEKALRRIGMSEKEIKKFEAVKTLENFLTQGRKNIKVEKENLVLKKTEINKRITKVDKRANPYRDKREEFVRVKEGRPLVIKVATRKRREDFKREEEIKSHAREEELETVEENKERLETSFYISGWNIYLQKKYGKDISNEFIDQKDFLEETGLSGNHKLDFKDFRNILGKYLKYKKLSTDKFNKNINRFFKEKIKTKK